MAFESIRNYYEQLVVDRIRATVARREDANDADYLEDVACVALNQLPARYIRHHVDLAFYLTAEERAHMQRAVENAVDTAVAYVNRHRAGARPRTITLLPD